jgi:hypothetical protein
MGLHFCKLSSQDGTKGYPHKMCWGKLEVLQYFNDVFGDRFEGILLVPNGLGQVDRLSMATKVNEQEVKFFLKVSKLLVPNRGASPSTVDEDDPLATLGMQKLLVVQHAVKTRLER